MTLTLPFEKRFLVNKTIKKLNKSISVPESLNENANTVNLFSVKDCFNSENPQWVPPHLLSLLHPGELKELCRCGGNPGWRLG